MLFAASVAFGLGVGNVITLPPLLAYTEFGARSFAIVFGMASAAMQIGVASAPGSSASSAMSPAAMASPSGCWPRSTPSRSSPCSGAVAAGPRFDSPTPTR